jgi:hypothetical protein
MEGWCLSVSTYLLTENLYYGIVLYLELVAGGQPSKIYDPLFFSCRSQGLNMKFNIYGRSRIEVRREDDSWEVHRHERGARLLDDPYIPSFLETEDLTSYLDDICVELAGAAPESVLLS